MRQNQAFIRPATLADCYALALIQVDSYQNAYAGLLPEDYLAHFTYEDQEGDWRDLISSGTGDIILVAEPSPGMVVGYTLGRVRAAEIPSYDCEMISLHVRRDQQDLGYGQALTKALAAQLRCQGCEALLLWVLEGNPARRFYERLGGRVIGQHQVEIGENVFASEVAYGWPDIRILFPGSTESNP